MEIILKSNISKLAAKTQLFLEAKKESKNFTKDQAQQFFNLRNEATELSRLTSIQWLQYKGDKKNALNITPHKGNMTKQTEVLKIQKAALIELRDFLKLNFDLEYINPHSICFE